MQMRMKHTLLVSAIALGTMNVAYATDKEARKISQCRVSMMNSLFPDKAPDQRVAIVQKLVEINDLEEEIVENEKPLKLDQISDSVHKGQLLAIADSQHETLSATLASSRTFDATELLASNNIADDTYLYSSSDIESRGISNSTASATTANLEVESTGDMNVASAFDEQARITENNEYRFKLYNGLVKTQMDFMVAELFPEYTPYWGRYEGRHEWFGQHELVSKDRWELIDKLATTFNIQVEVYPNNVIEFIYTKG